MPAQKLHHFFASVVACGVATLTIALFFTSSANAFLNRDFTTSFDSCPNPGGSLVVSYTDGNHWIVGNGQLQWGSDSVSNLGNNNYTQCFCPLTVNDVPTGELGRQTNWVYAGNLSSIQRQLYLNSGWTSVADGSVFGLTTGEYLARNSSFFCGTQGNITIRTGNASNTVSISNFINTNRIHF